MPFRLRPLSTPTSLILFSSPCLFADGKIDVAPVGEIGNTTYKCVLRADGTKGIIFINGKGKESEFDENQSNRKLKHEASKINKKKKQVKEKVTNKAKRKKKIEALKEKKNAVNKAKSSAQKCFSGELSLERTDSSGFYRIEIPMEVIPPGTNLGDIRLEMVPLDDLTLLPEPREVFQVQPDGIQLISPGGTFTFPIGSANTGGDSLAVMPLKLPDAVDDTTPSDDIFGIQSARIAESDSAAKKTAEEIKEDRGKGEFAFSEFARYVFGEVETVGPQPFEGSSTHRFNLPDSAFLGETFDFNATLMRFIGGRMSESSDEGGMVTARIVAAVGTLFANMKLEVSDHVKPNGKIDLGAKETQGDAIQFLQPFTCEKVGTATFGMLYRIVMKAENSISGMPVKDAEYYQKGTLKVECKLRPKPCKPKVKQEITAPNPGEKKSEFFVVQFDASKKPTGDFKLENPKTADNTLVPGSTSESTESVPCSELPDDLKSVLMPDKGKQVFIAQLDVDGGDGGKHNIEFTAFCES